MVSSTLCPALHILGSQNVYRGYCCLLLALGRLFLSHFLHDETYMEEKKELSYLTQLVEKAVSAAYENMYLSADFTAYPYM